MYFANFPSIVYDATGNFDFKVVTNLLRRVALRQKVRDNTLIFDTYDVGNGETPEILADKLYGESELHWIILLLNNIVNCVFFIVKLRDGVPVDQGPVFLGWRLFFRRKRQ